MSFNRNVRAVLLTGALSLLLPSAGSSSDRKAREQDEVRAALRRGTILPLAEILAIVAQRSPGNITKIELEHEDAGMLIYGIKVLGADGQVQKLKIDASSDVVLRAKTDEPD